MSANIKEKLLLYKAQSNRDPEAFAKLYDIYVKRIYRFIFFKVSSHEEAEDICSEVFLKAWNFIIKGDEVESFSGLLYRIARNSIIDLYRQRSSRVDTVAVDEIELGDKGQWAIDMGNKIENQNILSALSKLKHEYREVVTFKYVDGLEIGEIAEIVGKGNIAVRVTLHRGLKKLKEMMKEENG